MPARLGLPVFACLAAAAVSAQSIPSVSNRTLTGPRPDPRVVRLDLSATRDGHPVDDLTRAEVEVREDGVVQTVDDFTYVRADGAKGPNPDSGLETGTPGAGRPRRLVVFLDTYHSTVEQSGTLRTRLADRLDAVVGATDEVAVVTPDTDPAAVTFLGKPAALDRIRHGDGRSVPAQRDLVEARDAQCVGGSTSAATAAGSPGAEMTVRRRERLTLDAIERTVGAVSLHATARTPVVLVTDGWRLFRPNPDLGRARADRGLSRRDLGRGRSPVSGGGRNDAMPSSDPDCAVEIAALASLEHSTRLLEIGEWANRGLLSFYPVTAAALTSAADETRRGRVTRTAGEESFDASRADSLRLLAEETGGTAAVGHAEDDRVWDALVADGSHYLLAYAPTNARLDGRFRAVTVTVSRPGVRAKTRRGYRGLSVADLFGGAALSSRRDESPDPGRRTIAAARPQFRIRSSSWAYRRDDRIDGGFWVVGELDFRLRHELVWSAGAEADITVLSGDGVEVLSRTVVVPATAGGFGLRVPEDAHIAPGDYAVRVRIRPLGADDMALTDTARVVVPATTSELGEAVMWRRGPSTGPRFMMTADARFERRDKLRLELPADAAGPATARMLDRMRQPIQVPVVTSDRVDPADGMRWIVAETTLSPLAMGEYAIEVAVEGRRRVTTFQIVP